MSARVARYSYVRLSSTSNMCGRALNARSVQSSGRASLVIGEPSKHCAAGQRRMLLVAANVALRARVLTEPSRWQPTSTCQTGRRSAQRVPPCPLVIIAPPNVPRTRPIQYTRLVYCIASARTRTRTRTRRTRKRSSKRRAESR